jgi:PhnB protein
MAERKSATPLYVPDVDKAMARAVAAGATVKRAATDEFYGDRAGQVEEPFGRVWVLHTRFETVTPREMQKRLDKMIAEQAGAPPPTKKGKVK